MHQTYSYFLFRIALHSSECGKRKPKGDVCVWRFIRRHGKSPQNKCRLETSIRDQLPWKTLRATFGWKSPRGLDSFSFQDPYASPIQSAAKLPQPAASLRHELCNWREWCLRYMAWSAHHDYPNRPAAASDVQ